MKDLIKNLLRESLLGEIASGADKLPKGTGLFVKEGDSTELVLYNPELDEVYAIINTSYNLNKSDFFYVISVAAQKGLGPFIYELAMMYINEKHGNFLTPIRDGNIRGKAWNIWHKMYDRSDVIKKHIPIASDNFRFDILTGEHDKISNQEKLEWYDEATPDEQYDLKIFNTGYQMQPNSDYHYLLKVAQQYGKEDYQRATERGHDLWTSSYD